MTRQQAAEALGVEESTLKPFSEPDTFNQDVLLTGFLCTQSDHRYGALVITSVDGEPCHQVVYATPKLHYPFPRSGKAEEQRRYEFPAQVRLVEVYAKADGTNILAYSYATLSGKRNVTFKTRLTPVVRDSGDFGNFAQMWAELLQSQPDLQQLCRRIGLRSGAQTLSFEMYGYRNRHLVLYPEPLRAALLFVVDQETQGVVPPSRVTPATLCHLQPEFSFTDASQLVTAYEQMCASAEAQNVKYEDDEGEDAVQGIEGYIFYVLDEDGRWHLFKAKPESIEALHWASNTLPKAVIVPTVRNAMESFAGDRADPEQLIPYVMELLSEEFSQQQMMASVARIHKAVGHVIRQAQWSAQVRKVYQEVALPWTKSGKGAVMRAMSGHFERKDMSRVYGALTIYLGEPK